MSAKYTDVIVTVSNGIGTIKLNRPKALNSFGGNLMTDVVTGLRELNDHPDTVFTVITGEGRFVSRALTYGNVSHSSGSPTPVTDFKI